jgi:hypothetical protein
MPTSIILRSHAVAKTACSKRFDFEQRRVRILAVEKVHGLLRLVRVLQNVRKFEHSPEVRWRAYPRRFEHE